MMLNEIKKYFNCVVVTSSLSQIKEQLNNCIVVNDARSALYFATGIAAETKKRVAVIVNGNNESRSAFSGMTEAYYRNLPVALFSLNDTVDYSKMLNDTCSSVYSIDVAGDLGFLNTIKLPSHISIHGFPIKHTDIEVSIDVFNVLLRDDDYLYFSKNIALNNDKIKCKKVCGGLLGSYDGAIANVLGASLAKKHKRYFGIVTEDEFLHDMNTLGNVCFNNSIRLVCLSKKQVFIDYAKNLGLDVVDSPGKLESDKSILFIDNFKL